MEIPAYHFRDGIRLFNIGDVHRGDHCINKPLFYKVIKEVETDPSAYWVSTGDLCNVALKTSKSDCYESLSLNQEIEAITEELAGIAHKCLGVVASNHHNRLVTLTGLNLDTYICGKLEIPYLGALGVIRLICGRASYIVVMHHGVGGGKKRGGKTNNTEALSEIVPGADLYLEGHTHSFDHFINETTYLDRKRGLLTRFQSTFVTTGHFLNYERSYAVDMKLPARPLGAAMIEFDGHIAGRNALKKIRADLFN